MLLRWFAHAVVSMPALLAVKNIGGVFFLFYYLKEYTFDSLTLKRLFVCLFFPNFFVLVVADRPVRRRHGGGGGQDFQAAAGAQHHYGGVRRGGAYRAGKIKRELLVSLFVTCR